MPDPRITRLPMLGQPEPWTVVLQTDQGPKQSDVVVVASFSDSAQMQIAGIIAQVVAQTVEKAVELALAARDAKAAVEPDNQAET